MDPKKSLEEQAREIKEEYRKDSVDRIANKTKPTLVPQRWSSCQEVCKRHQAAFSSDTSLTGTPFTYLAPW